MTGNFNNYACYFIFYTLSFLKRSQKLFENQCDCQPITKFHHCCMLVILENLTDCSTTLIHNICCRSCNHIHFNSLTSGRAKNYMGVCTLVTTFNKCNFVEHLLDHVHIRPSGKIPIFPVTLLNLYQNNNEQLIMKSERN